MKVALTLGEPTLSQTHYVLFFVVKLPLSYNAILGRPMLYDCKAITSIRYLNIQFPTDRGVGFIRGRQEEDQAVYLATIEEQYIQLEKVNPEVMEVIYEKKEALTNLLISWRPSYCSKKATRSSA